MSRTRRQFLADAAVSAVAAAGAGWLAAPFGASAGTRGLPQRPPGALPEDEFLSRCIRCLRCVEACPNQAIVPLGEASGRQRASTPSIQPRRQACMLCNKETGDYLKCGEACPSGALQKIGRSPEAIQQQVEMGVAELDLALCYSWNNWSCGACYRACPFPEKAMKLGLWERPEVVADACVGCGLCERACIRYPQAIRVKPRSG